LLGRYTGDPATSDWKGYRGGCVGSLWIDKLGSGAFEPLLCLEDGNIGTPIWVADNKVVFVSDHDGPGAVYSCDATTGADVKLMIQPPQGFYIRHLAADASNQRAETLVFMAGGCLYRTIPGSETALLAYEAVNIRSVSSNKILGAQ
jgi:tricorn protease-like protein